MRATEMEQNALRGVINLIEDSQLVNLSEHRVIDVLNVWPCSIAIVLTKKLSYLKTLPSTSISAGILYCSGRYGHDLEDGHHLKIARHRWNFIRVVRIFTR